MGIVFSVHTFLHEFIEPSINQDAGNICTSITIGRGVMLGGGLIGLGALLYYSSRLSPQDGAVDHYKHWPPYIRERIMNTYFYYGSSLIVATISMVTVYQSAALMEFLTRNTLGTTAAAIVAMILTGALVQSIPYTQGVGPKQFAFIVHSATIGAVVAPIAILGGTVMFQAAWVTAAIVGVFSMIAAMAPLRQAFTMGVPLGLCVIAVSVASIGGIFWPTSTNPGAHMYAINLYLGMLVFSGFVTYHSQGIYALAEAIPEDNLETFDPINASISIFLDTLNIFIRVAVLMLSTGTSPSKKKVCKPKG